MPAKERIHWVDIAKGVLIILVVYGHIDYFAETFVGWNVFEFKRYTNFLFLPFYMPAFFVLTGYCSSFNSSFTHFFSKNFKTLMVPSMLIGGILSYCLEHFLGGGLSYHSFLEFNYLELLMTGGSWFLASLFISKLIVYMLVKNSDNQYVTFLLSLGIMLLGTFLYEKVNTLNFWSFQHAMILCPFLLIGYDLKSYHQLFDYKKILALFGCLALAIITYMEYRGIPWPYINANPNVTLYSVIPYYLVAMSLILMLFLLCKMIDKCRLLEILGRHTLVIYLLHFSIFVFFIRQFVGMEVIASSLFTKIIFAIFSMGITIFICILLDIIIDKKFGFLKGVF